LLLSDGVSITSEESGSIAVTGLDAREIGEIASAHNITLHELASEQASLEEAFMRLTKDDVEYHASTPALRGSEVAA
jgi:ABC-2 type transport system ATP-binding protein